MPAEPPDCAPKTGGIDPHVKRVAVVIVLGSIMSVLDTTIVNVALDSLSRDLHTPLSDIQWVTSAYLLALAAVIPLCGWAVRRYGAFRVYLQALILFTLGSALCGVATSFPELIAFRALQGVGGGLLVPTGLTILVKAAGRTNLPKVMSLIGVPIVLAPVFGPTVGGLLLQTVGWHAIFMVNVPIGIATTLVALRLLPRDAPDRESAGRLDWQGLLLAGAGAVGIIYGLSESATAESFTSGTVVVPILVGLLLVATFVIRTRRIDYPLLDLQLYKTRAYSSAVVVMLFLERGTVRGATPVAAVLSSSARPGRHPHGSAAHPHGHRRRHWHEPFCAGDGSIRRRPHLALRGCDLGGQHHPVPLRRRDDVLCCSRRGDGGEGSGGWSGAHASHDRRLFDPRSRSDQRRQPSAQHHPTGRGLTRDRGDRGNSSEQACSSPPACQRQCHRCRLR